MFKSISGLFSASVLCSLTLSSQMAFADPLQKGEYIKNVNLKRESAPVAKVENQWAHLKNRKYYDKLTILAIDISQSNRGKTTLELVRDAVMSDDAGQIFDQAGSHIIAIITWGGNAKLQKVIWAGDKEQAREQIRNVFGQPNALNDDLVQGVNQYSTRPFRAMDLAKDFMEDLLTDGIYPLQRNIVFIGDGQNYFRHRNQKFKKGHKRIIDISKKYCLQVNGLLAQLPETGDEIASVDYFARYFKTPSKDYNQKSIQCDREGVDLPVAKGRVVIPKHSNGQFDKYAFADEINQALTVSGF